MKNILRLVGFVITLACVSAVVALAAQQQKPAETPKEAPKTDRGEAILKETCLSCHELDRITLQFFDKDEWTAKIKTMVELGAKVKSEDMTPLVDYLVKKYGYTLPDGEGKVLVEKTCKGCHDPQRIVTKKWSRARWDNLLDEMVSNGADIPDDEYDVLLAYLAKNFK